MTRIRLGSSRPVPAEKRRKGKDGGSGHLFRLETTDGQPADPPTLSAAVPNWPIGSTMHVPGRALVVVG
jgi:hypothetical protein